MNAPSQYLSTLADQGGQEWNRFWFTPASPRMLSCIRIATGLLAVSYFMSWNGSLLRWFGVDGMLPAETVASFLAENNRQHFHLSPLFVFDANGLWCFHLLAIALSMLFTLGVLSRLSGVLTLAVVLAYVHRAPMLISPFESVLVMLLCYLPIGPCGAYYSLDARFAKPTASLPSWTANLSLRLMQLHTAGFILLIAASMFSSNAWWNGTAIWILEAQTSTRPLDLSAIRNYPLFVNGWTHLFVLVNLLFPALVWNRLLRPLVIITISLLWITLIPISGQVHYICAMMVAFASFWECDDTCAYSERKLD